MYANRSEPEQIRAFADIYWRILLPIAISVVLFASIYGALELTSVLRDADFSLVNAASPQPRPAFNRVQLQDTLDGFEARKQLFESLKTDMPNIADPSN